MSSYALTGQDTIIINDRVLSDGLSTGTVATITYENDSSAISVGKDGNAIFAQNQQGLQATLELRILRGSNDDKFLNGLYAQQTANYVGFTLLTGVLVKKIGDGQGNIINDTTTLSAGTFLRGIDTQSNVEGDAEQGTSVYRFRYAKALRTIG